MPKKIKDAKLTDKASEMAKSIWLAGLGAYGRAFAARSSTKCRSRNQPCRNI